MGILVGNFKVDVGLVAAVGIEQFSLQVELLAQFVADHAAGQQSHFLFVVPVLDVDGRTCNARLYAETPLCVRRYHGCHAEAQSKNDSLQIFLFHCFFPHFPFCIVLSRRND